MSVKIAEGRSVQDALGEALSICPGAVVYDAFRSEYSIAKRKLVRAILDYQMAEYQHKAGKETPIGRIARWQTLLFATPELVEFMSITFKTLSQLRKPEDKALLREVLELFPAVKEGPLYLVVDHRQAWRGAKA